MGVRYNAEKSKVGNYYSTPIYKFRMKCHLCDNYFEIQTDPKNHDYVILSGARRKEQRWDPVANGQIMPEDKATQKKLATDPMYKLEHGSDDHQKGKDKISSLAELEEGRISMIDDYLLNRMARDKFRSEKKQLREAAEAEKAILDKSSLDIELVEESEEDKRLAGLLKYSVTTSFEEKQKQRRKSIEQRPIFSDGRKMSASSSGSSPASSLLQSISTSSPLSSNLLSQPLPYQRHARPKLSHRGQLKQKLGWAIKASYKDPFKSKSDKTSHASTIQRQLGIKVKPSTHNEQLNHSDSSGKEEKSSSSSTDQQSVSPSEKEENCTLRSADSDGVLPSSSSFQDCDSQDKSKKSPVCGETTDSQLNCAIPSNHSEPNSTVDEDIKQRPYEESSLESRQKDPLSMALSEENHSLAAHPHDTSNSGLQALICSYGSSDSDSS
ncbi:hypothetical protein EGW08_009168 [Elysia chlorotica]|uniref:Coiled-coil domain-containing protein 130 n=1 Tax=Elysia chlorotica TaxID=188477 RepID=A0A433TNB9_ELYCH|nr:hypothetical protein EGW08_009168 [Elysia chlorotica]